MRLLTICCLLVLATIAHADQPWKRHVIDDTSRGADGVRLADVNGDGLLDVATGWEEGGKVRAYRNPGPAKATMPWPKVTVGGVASPEDAVFVDLDADGATDVVSCCEGGNKSVYIHWAPKDAMAYLKDNAWKSEAIPAAAKKAAWMFALPMDIDGEHGVDLVIASKGSGNVGWLKSPENPRNLAAWTFHPLYDAGWIMSLVAHDMDDDGDLDVLLSDRKGSSRGARWLENPGLKIAKQGKPWKTHLIGGNDREMMFLTVADLNQDGQDDVLSAVKGRGVAVFLGTGKTDTPWKANEIAWPDNCGTGKGVAVGDIDLDGKNDVVFSCEHAVNGKSGARWLSGDTSLRSANGVAKWTDHEISGPTGIKFDRIELLDVDGDGDLDMMTCEERELNAVIWYENPTRTPKPVAPSPAPSPEPRKPNVIFIFTDDQGSIDVNCYGAKDLATPHMDALANRGVRFSQFYAAAPVCSPSRAALLTGRYPQRAQLGGNASSHPDGHGMPTEQATVAEIFKSAGYATAHIGKWHLGYVPEEMPNGQGFDHSFGHMGGCIDNYSHFFYWAPPNRHDLWRNGKEVWEDGKFFPNLMVEEAGQFIDKNKDRPFFMYWAINLPHYPLQGTEKWRKKYKDLPAPRRMYAEFVSTMDEKIGELLAKVEEAGLTDDTIVVFQSDHGHSTESRTFGGGGSAGPYRGAKFSLFEGGIRVPAIISWPGHIPQGEVRGQMATACDWLPTVADLAGVSLPKRKIDGKSLRAVLDSMDAESPHSEFHWQTSGNSCWAVRQGDWKLLGNPRDTSNKAPITAKDKLFLVNLTEDVSEMKNLAADNSEVVERLKALHDKWVKEVQRQ
jgi:arylsulfatase A